MQPPLLSLCWLYRVRGRRKRKEEEENQWWGHNYNLCQVWKTDSPPPRESSHLLTKSRERGTLHCLTSYSTPVQKYPRAASFKDLFLRNLKCLYKMPNTPISIFFDLCTEGGVFSLGRTGKGEPWTTCSNKRIPCPNRRAVKHWGDNKWFKIIIGTYTLGENGEHWVTLLKITQRAILLCCQDKNQRKRGAKI